MEEQDKAQRRATSIRKTGTGKVPVAQAPAPDAAPAEETASAAPSKSTARKLGTGKIPGRKSAGERMIATSKPPSKVGKFIKILMILMVFVGTPLLAIGGFVIRKNGHPIWFIFLSQIGMMKLERTTPERPKETMSDMDIKYNNALIARARAEMYIKQDIRIAKDQMDTLDGAKADTILKNVKIMLDEITASLDHISAVVEETHKPEGTSQSKIDNLGANHEMNAQTKFRKELLGMSNEWKEIADLKNGRVAPKPEIAKKPEPEKPKEPEKPSEPEKPKPAEPEKPKPAEPEKPKPEPTKPEPAKPAEPEKPKPVEPAKPAEPEKPKPAEPEKPKPVEPEKPKVPAKTPEQLVAEADKLIAEGNPLALEVVKGSRPLPEDADKRKDLAIQCETAMAFFSKAKGILEEVKDGLSVGDKLAKIEKVLGILQNVQDGLKSK